VKQNGGGRPGLFDAAFLVLRYRSEYAILELPAFVRRVIVPIAYLAGKILGKHKQYRDAPPPITAR
jgi:hypothetical protein